MPIVSKPASIEKNAVAVFTLDKTVLAAVASVVADSYFSDSTKWSEVLIYYKSSEGNQREILKFDATQASPTANFLVSEFARDIFEVQKIVIKDFDNGSFVVQRSELVAAEFDVDMSGGGSGGGVLKISQELNDGGTLPLTLSATGEGQTFTPQENFSLTGVEFNFDHNGTDSIVELRLTDFSDFSRTLIAQSNQILITSSGFTRFDFSNIPLTSGVNYHLEIKLVSGSIRVFASASNPYLDGVLTFNGYSGFTQYDYTFKIYGN